MRVREVGEGGERKSFLIASPNPEKSRGGKKDCGGKKRKG